jgi:hypothetical protein
MHIPITSGPPLDGRTRAFYRRAVDALQHANLPFVVGGAFALAQYTGIARYTKDLDVFVREQDVAAALRVLERETGCRTEITAPAWLAKAIGDDACVDVIFCSGNGLSRVDDLWFARARFANVLGFQVSLCPPEELVWSKAFIMERERFDGADIAHILHAQARRLDWAHLLWRFGAHWRVLLDHLILFGYSYPHERDAIPRAVLEVLMERLRQETSETPPSDRVCQGTLLSVAQYTEDVQLWGYEDARERTGGETLRAYQDKQRHDAAGTEQHPQ